MAKMEKSYVYDSKHLKYSAFVIFGKFNIIITISIAILDFECRRLSSSILSACWCLLDRKSVV